MWLYTLIALGGALGSVARFWLNGVVSTQFGETFPWGTLIVNVSGSFVIGFFATLTGPYAGLPSLIPKETDNGFDMRGDMIGTRAWVLSEYKPSVGMSFKRNADYYEKDRPFIDAIEAPFVTEYAQQVAQ